MQSLKLPILGSITKGYSNNSFNKYLLSACFRPDTLLTAENTKVKNSEKGLNFYKQYF